MNTPTFASSSELKARKLEIERRRLEILVGEYIHDTSCSCDEKTGTTCWRCMFKESLKYMEYLKEKAK